MSVVQKECGIDVSECKQAWRPETSLLVKIACFDMASGMLWSVLTLLPLLSIALLVGYSRFIREVFQPVIPFGLGSFL
jgi:lysylphosphatidylglycerol synthetase-like protein (DUF2156 family)